MKIRNQKDFVAGLMFLVIGLAFAFVATSYHMGSTAKMGPGYFPFWLGILMAILGLMIAIGALSPKAIKLKLAKWDWKPVLWVSGSVLLFATSLPYLGLIASLLVLIFISAMASHEFHWKGTVISAVILNIIAYVAFVWGLQLQITVWPSFLKI